MIGRFVYQYRWQIAAAWLLVTGAIALFAPRPDKTVGESSDLLPANTPVHIALDELTRHFGDKAALSDLVVVFERADGPVTKEDLKAIEDLGDSLAKPSPGESIDEELRNTSIRTPKSLALAGHNPLISDDRHAALISMSLPYNFITKNAARVVKHAQEIVAAAHLPTGLSAAVTGSAGYGYDYAIATERSHTRTTIVTLTSVILILLMIYRAPIAAMIPLMGISMAAGVVLNLLNWGERIGLHNGMAERIFTFVLLYGAGIDYSVLFISRYREFLDEGRTPADSIVRGLNASLAAIVSSTTMTVAGMLMLLFARFSIFRNAGPSVILALIVSAAAAATLVPALLAIIGPRAFWPSSRNVSLPNVGRALPAMTSPGGQCPPYMEDPDEKAGSASRTVSANREALVRDADPTPIPRTHFWPALAEIVVARPALVLIATLAVLMPAAVRGSRFDWNYDALTSLKSSYPARRGTEMVKRHWPIGETGPVTIVAVADQPQTNAQWQTAAAAMVKNVGAVPDVNNIRSLQSPLGTHMTPAENFTIQLLARDRINAEFLSRDNQAMRLQVILDRAPLSREALADVAGIRSAATRALESANLKGRIYLAGQTAEMIDMAAITHHDFHRVAALALIAILIMITLALRDFALAVFILAATVLSYLTTLGLTYWIFNLFGHHGLEWKVQMLLFMVLVAVGQDYSLFFALRVAQEARDLPCIEATKRALIFTGPVISSCGLIMAATLGSVMAGDVQTLVQLGFAFALGMLIDTFVVRPLLLPAFIVLTGRTLKKAGAIAG